MNVVLTDGALGTEYQRLGLPAGSCADFWTLENPGRVYEVTKAYADAGSDVVLTTTFRANAVTLAEYGRAADSRAVNVAGAKIARQAAGPGKRVFGDVGPSGKLLIAGEITEDELRRGFAAQCDALAEGGVDAIVLETFSDAGEARIALEAGRAAGKPVIVSFAFDTGRNQDRTMTGLTPEQAARQMTDAGADGVGANCGAGFDAFTALCRRFRASTSLPIWIKPNAGLPELSGGTLTYRSSPEQFGAVIPAYVEAGATYIGGCCGTSPAFIRAAADVLREMRTTQATA